MVKKVLGGFLVASGDSKGWRDIPEGGVIPNPGNSEEYYTGGWRTFRPMVDKVRCINCLSCWINCPDMSVIVENENMQGYDYDHCKGCGICSDICPVKCIQMVEEDKLEELNKGKDFDDRGRTRTVSINMLKSDKK
jgi:pyruvate ferredoxin oxidoreductase delta subunit